MKLWSMALCLWAGAGIAFFAGHFLGVAGVGLIPLAALVAIWPWISS